MNKQKDNNYKIVKNEYSSEVIKCRLNGNYNILNKDESELKKTVTDLTKDKSILKTYHVYQKFVTCNLAMVVCF